MIVPDVNLLLYAYNRDAPEHDEARIWWESCLSGSETVGLTYPVLFAFVRIATGTYAMQRPMSVADAASCIELWRGRRVVRVIEPDSDYVVKVLKLLRSTGSAGGNLVTDAQIAALALQHDGTIHTADRDFEKFDGLKVVYPLD